ncbi:accessory Sec system protein Asp2 [Enterococcus lactis]|uniref:accessory Sec system protein Asp2 n=1 Tax=Enterococcus lactis TaxID=357441 RepID=UPI0034E969B0
MSEKSNYLFHIGGVKLPSIDELAENYVYLHLEISDHLKQDLIDLQPMTNDQINNSSNLFLLSREAMSQLNQIDLLKLPSYQIFYEQLNGASEAEVRLLNLKGAQRVDLSDGGVKFIQFVNKNYIKPWGTSLDNSMVEINSNFTGSVTKKGSAMYVLDGEFGLDYQQVMLWKNKWGASGHVNFYPEMNYSGQISYYWRAYYKNNEDNQNIQYTDIYPEQVRAGQVSFDLGYSDFPVNFGLFVKGNGRIQVGDLHIRYGLDGNNFLAMGGRRLVQPDEMGEELGYYFNAGDLKPPLNVYFSGFRPSEGYEGRWMMGSLGSPFILVYDPRLVGGSFYRGASLEKALIKVIQEKLTLLGFSTRELILSGLSMGTYASFYYGAQLEPHAIIVGKPLANIGGLAINSRIFSPYDWDLAMDTIIHLTGELTKESAKALDEDFWQKFESANFSETTFIIAHMLQDTDTPFKRIFNHLKKNYPKAKVLHKGLEGRHNDNTPGVTSWFYKQYQQLLISDFNRRLVVDEDVEEIDWGEENGE